MRIAIYHYVRQCEDFYGASAEGRRIQHSTTVKQQLANRQVQWEFIVEKAPWWGDYWERLVQSVKRCLKKTIGRTTLTFEELRTVTVKIKATLNNRPLTYIYDDADGVSRCLTPSDLIYGYRSSNVPSERHFEVTSTSKSLTRKARYQFRLLSEFTRQWRRDYLLSIREMARAKARHNHGNQVVSSDSKG